MKVGSKDGKEVTVTLPGKMGPFGMWLMDCSDPELVKDLWRRVGDGELMTAVTVFNVKREIEKFWDEWEETNG